VWIISSPSLTLTPTLTLVRQLEEYQKNGRLLLTAQFITFNVNNLYTIIPRDDALKALGRFGLKHSNNDKLGNLLLIF
jgi:hypothetical protein